MEIRHLRYFVTVAEELSFTRAAEKLNVSQPGLSRQIRDLESELGNQLFVRSSRSVVLSNLGQRLFKKARKVIGSFDAISEEAANFYQDVTEQIEVGYLSHAFGGIIVGAIEELTKTRPELRVKLHDSSPFEMVNQLRDGKIDLVLMNDPENRQHLEFDVFEVGKIPLDAVVSRKHPIAAKSSIHLSDLKNDPFIGLNDNLYPGRIKFLTELCQQSGFTPNFHEITDSLGSVISLIAAGAGVSLVPREARITAPESAVFVPIEEPQIHINLRGVFRKNETRSTVGEFLTVCQSLANRA